MKKVLVIKTNTLLNNKSLEEVRKGVIKQINDRGVVVLDGMYTVENMEIDFVEAKHAYTEENNMDT